ncbi:hypothetical protein [Tengunoibacter tsumagoiensis]|nr:hypothetical protein [Tengunoibacter tsumagoiensis]
MRRNLLVRATRSQRQAYTLLIVGIILLLGAWLLHINPYAYPLGVFLLGAGMLVAAFIDPARLMIAGSMTTAIGIAVFLGFRGLIPGSQIFPTYILALGIGLLAVAFAARRGYVGRGAISPAIIVLGVGLIEILLAAHLTPSSLIPFALSLWFPGLGLILLGILYLIRSMKEVRESGAV